MPTATQPQYTYLFTDPLPPGSDPDELLGGKGKNLARLTQEGFNVPRGGTVTAQAYFDSLPPAIRRFMSSIVMRLDGTDKGYKCADKAIKDALLSEPLPAEIERQVRELYITLCEIAGDPELKVAVRSSSTKEDGDGGAAAGAQSTFLNVSGADAVVAAFRLCLASLWNHWAISYRDKKEFDHLNTGLAVVIMPMVQSQRSWVVMTRSKTDGNPNKIVVSVADGLGEDLVAGRITGHNIVFDRQSGGIIEEHIAPQPYKLVSNREWQFDLANPFNLEGANIQVEVEPDRVSAPKVTPEEAYGLYYLALQVEEAYEGVHQDVEGAIVDGKFVVLQSRPLARKRIYTPPLPAPEETTPRLPGKGIAAGEGVVYCPVKILDSPNDNGLVQEGDGLVTNMTDPAFLEAMEKAGVFVTATGGPNCHAAVTADELEVPCIVGFEGVVELLRALQQEQGVDQFDPDGPQLWITIDGSHGVIYLGKATATLEWWEQRKIQIEEAEAKAANLETRVTVRAVVNGEGPGRSAARRGAQGIGLFRLEEDVLRTKRHWQDYINKGETEDFIRHRMDVVRPLLNMFPDEDVFVRGPDNKPHEQGDLLGAPAEEQGLAVMMSSAMGVRGCAYYLARPDIFMELELEAIRRLVYDEGYTNIVYMLPVVRTVQDLIDVTDMMIEMGLGRSEFFDVAMMLEIPANVDDIEEFAATGRIGKISIGGNDLMQFYFGASRDVAALAKRYNVRQPAIRRKFVEIVRRAKAAGLKVSFCGNAVSKDRKLAPELDEAGIDDVAVTPRAVAPTRIALWEGEQERMTA